MTYVDHVYGNHIEFTDKQSKRKREQTLIHDKNQFVYFACIYRKRWSDIESFKDYRYNPKNGACRPTLEQWPRPTCVLRLAPSSMGLWMPACSKRRNAW